MAAGKSGSIWASLGLQTKDFEKGVNRVQGQMKSFGSDIVKNTAGILAGAFAVDSLITFGKEASEMAGKLEGIKAGFDLLNNASLLGDLQRATKGTVSDLNLMKNAVQAKNLGLPVQQLATYFEFARRRAASTGESVDFLVESIVKGIGRKSPLILDNLGISVSALNAEIEKTGDFGIAAANIIESEMAGMAEDTETAADRTAKLNAQWENTKTTLGGVINQGLEPIQGAIGNVVEGLNEMLTTTKDDNWKTFTAAYLKAWGGINIEVKSFNETLTDIIVKFEKLSKEQLTSEKGLRAFSKSMLLLGVSTEEAVKKYKSLLAAKTQTHDVKPVVRTISLIDEEIKAQQEMLGFASDRAGAIAIQERIAKLEREKERILGNTKALKEQIKLNKAKEGLDFSVSNVSTKGLQLKDSELPTFEIQQGIEALPSLFSKAMASLEMRVKRTEEVMKASASAINTAFANIAAEGLATLGAALGTAFAGGDVMQIGMQFANMIADAIGGLGRNLIEIGIVMTGIMETLKTGGFANPALLIGGGIALVALSSAMKGMASNSVGFADGGLVTGSVFANIGEGIGTNSANPEVIAPLDKLKNFINPQQNAGMGGNVSFRIEGNTLVGILDRQAKTTKYGR